MLGHARPVVVFDLVIDCGHRRALPGTQSAAMPSRRQASHSDRIFDEGLADFPLPWNVLLMAAAPANRFGRSTSRTNVVISTISPPIAPTDRRQSSTALAVSPGTQPFLLTP